MTAGQPAQFVGVPASTARRIVRTSTGVGVVVGALSVAALAAVVVFPYQVVPEDEQLRIWLPLIGAVAAAGALSAAAGALTARSWVRSGYLDLNKVSSTRSALRASCTMTTLGAVAACGIYLRIVSTAPATRFEWTYVTVLVATTLLPYLTLFALHRASAPRTV